MRVRISSDAAGAISLTPVVVRDLTREELLDHIVGVYGKDVARIHQVVARGTLVSGASRLRWDGFELSDSDLNSMLARFPDPDPTRIFSAERCTLAILRGTGHQIPLTKEAAAKRRLFRRHSFWEYLVTLGPGATYIEYSYREKADVYRARITPAVQTALQHSSRLLAYASVIRQLDSIAIDSVDLYVSR